MSSPNPASKLPLSLLLRASQHTPRSVVPDEGEEAERDVVAPLVGMSGSRVRSAPRSVPPPVTGRRGRPSFLATPLSRIMKANGHSNKQLAGYLGCGQRTVEYWNQGAKDIPQRYLPMLCELYGRDEGYFMLDDDGELSEEDYEIVEEFFTI